LRFVGPPPPVRRLIVAAPIQNRPGMQRSPSSDAPVVLAPLVPRGQERDQGPSPTPAPLIQSQQQTEAGRSPKRRADIHIPSVGGKPPRRLRVRLPP
jgi:hypothetical protein